VTKNEKYNLIVDDTIRNIELLQILLEGVGYQVITAIGGRQALKLISDSKVDLILLDLRMPEMDGFEVLDCMNNNGTKLDIPVIMVSGHFRKENVDLALSKGAKDFAPKPFIFDELMRKVNHFLQ